MKRLWTIATALAMLACSVSAQVPVTRWHSDTAVHLPAGALQITGERCIELFAALDHADVEPKICYFWQNSMGVYDSLMAWFAIAGYGVVQESVLNETTVFTVVMRPERPLIDLLLTSYTQNNGMMIVTYQEVLE